MLSVTWDGGGNDGLWSTDANWVGDQAPTAGEDIVFSGTAQTNTENDLTCAFGSLTFNSSNFTVSGNTVLLDGNITVNSGVTGTSFSADVSFTDEADIDLGYGASLSLDDIANADDLEINVPSGSSMSVSGQISGGGELALDVDYGSTMTIGGGIAGSSDVTIDVGSGSSMTVDGGLLGIGGLTAAVGTGASLDIDGGISASDQIALTQSDGSTMTVDGAIANTTGLTVTGGWGATTALTGDIAGAGGLTKGGGSVLTLSGHGTFTGTTEILAGTLTLETSDALGGSTLDYDSTGGSLDIGDLTSLVLGGLSGDEDLVLTADSTEAVALTVGGNGESTTYTGGLSGLGSLTKTGSGTLTLTEDATYAGVTTVEAGTLRLDSGVSLPTDTTATGGEVSLAATAQITGDLTVGTDGAVTFDGGGTVTGDATIAGLLNIDSGTATVNGTVHLLGGFSADPVTLAAGQGMVTSDLIIQRLVTLDGGMLDLSGGAISVDPYSGDGTLLSGTLRNVGEIQTYGFTPDFPVGLDKWGEGILTLLGTNTYSFQTRVFEGTLRLGDGVTNGTILGDVVNKSTLEFAPGSDQVFTGIISNVGSLVKSGDAMLTLLAENTYTGGTTIDGGTLRLGDGTTDGSIAGDIVNGGTLEFATASDRTFSGLISGTGDLVKSGAAVLTLPNANTYTGETAVQGGTLELGDPESLGTGTLDYAGGQIDIGGLTELTLGGLRGSGDLLLTGDEGEPIVLTVGGNGETTTYSGVLSGDGDLVKTGAGTLVLTGNNTYEGETTIEGGTLAVGNGGASGSLGTGTVIDEATLVYNTTTAQRAFVVGSGGLTLSGPGTFTIDCPGTPSVSITDPSGLLIPGGVSEVTAQTVLPGMPMTITATVADPWSECDSVTFYRDVNGDGTVDAGDTYLGDGTNSDGYWSTTVDTSGWGPTADAVLAAASFRGPSEHPPATLLGETAMKVRAEWAVVSPADQTGYTESGDGFSTVWTADAVGGRYREMSGTDQDAYVTLTFTGLSPGNYEVWEHYIVDDRFSTSVPIEVYDGDVATGTLQQSFNLNETAVRWSNWEVDGYDWNWSDDFFYSNSGTVTVRIGVGAGGVTQIPAIRLIAAPDSTTCNGPTSSDPVGLAKGDIQDCGCGDGVEGTYYNNLWAGLPGETGYGMFDLQPTLLGSGMYVTFAGPNGCPGDQFLEPLRTYSPLYGTKATLVDINEEYLKLTEADGTIHHFGYPTHDAYSIGEWKGTYYPDKSSKEVTRWETVIDLEGDDNDVLKMGEVQYIQYDADLQSYHAYRSEIYTYTVLTVDEYTSLPLRESVTYKNWDPDTSAWVYESKIEYEYYESNQTDLGLIGDLKTATTCYPVGTGWSDGDVTYFRYYTEATYDPPESTDEDDQIGFAHGLKIKLMPQAYATAEAYATSQSTTVEALDDEDLAEYTCFYYEYDSAQRVTYEKVYGELRATTYAYTEGSNAGDDTNEWTRRTVETRENGDTYTVYSNFLGEPILTDLADSSGNNHWFTYRTYDVNGNVLSEAESSTMDAYWDGQQTVVGTYTGATTPTDYAIHCQSTGGGLVYNYTYGTSETASESPAQDPAGDVIGYPKTVSVANGTATTAETSTTAEYSYYKHTDATSGQSVYHLATQTKYIDDDPNDPITIVIEYDDDLSWHSGVQINEEILNLPQIDTDQNGTNAEYQTRRWYDSNGNLTWTMDEAGRVTYYEYDADTDLVEYMIEDVDSTISSSLNPPTGYAGNTDGAHLRTDFQYDLSGRLILTVGPEHLSGETLVRTASGTIYNDADHEIISASGYAWYDTSVSDWKYTLVNPVSIVRTNRDGDVTEVIEATAETTTLSTTDPLGTIADETFTQSEYTSWTTYQYSHKQLVSTRAYHTIPTSGEGTATANYEETIYGYDSLGRLDYTETAAGGITFTTYDARGLLLSTWIGTNAVPTADYNGDGNPDVDDFRDWAADNPGATSALSGTTMSLVERNIYDSGLAGGDGLLTESRAYHDDGTNDYYATEYLYDWRGRLTDVRTPDNVVTHYTYDNLDRVTLTETYADIDSDYFTYTGNVITGTTVEGSELRGKREDFYDDLGRVYESHVYEVDPAVGDDEDNDYLPTETWYNERGLVIKTSDGNGLFTKYAYDGLGRQIASYLCYDTSESNDQNPDNTDADDLAGDTVIEQTEIWYNDASEVVGTAVYRRMPGDTSTEEALSATDSYVTVTLYWYDGVGRATTTVEYGREDVGSGLTHYIFNGTTGALIDTDSDEIPDLAQGAAPTYDTSDDYIVSTVLYDSAGRPVGTFDNRGRLDVTVYDKLGRVVRTIENWAGGVIAETDTDQDVTVEYEYDYAGRLVTMTAYNAMGNDDDPNFNVDEQKTIYLYTSTTDPSAVTEVIYPESTDVLTQDAETKVWTYTTDTGDHVETGYDRLGRTTGSMDQRGVVHLYSYDSDGRLYTDTVASLGGSQIVDGSVQRIQTEYDDVGRVQTVTSYDAATQGNVVNGVLYVYDGWGNVVREYQEHDGEVDAEEPGLSPHVDYLYGDGEVDNNGIAKHVRLEQVTYPDGREINYDYGTADAIDDIMSRLASIKDDDDSTVLASYRYLGAGRIVTEDYEEIQVNLDYAGETNTFSALDRFGRVTDQVWNDYGATAVRDRYTYTYDRVGNRTSRDNELDSDFDEDYIYDDLYRLTDFDRGAGVTQDWDLDALGNWGTFNDNGTSQTREVNEANEIEKIDTSTDDVAHDAAGNMIRVPKLDGSGDHFHLVYDAWNRLVEVYDDNGTTLIAQYQYDATGRRIVKGVDDGTDGSLDTFTHYFHSGTQVIETREGEDVSGAAPAAESLEPKYQNIWSPRYVDSMILRDEYDAGGDIITANRVYYLSDANYNVTALVDASGNVIERYLYTPYGTVTVLDPDFSVDADGVSDYDNTTLYTGRELDAETELMYYRARYYHSELGRFVSRDPIGYDAREMDLYCYVRNTPTDLIDPFGYSAFATIHWVYSFGQLTSAPAEPPGKPPVNQPTNYTVIDSSSKAGPNKTCCDDKADQVNKGKNPLAPTYGSPIHKCRLKQYFKNPKRGATLPATADGATVCCDGNIVVCVWADEQTLKLTVKNDQARKFIASCIVAHEGQHAQDIKCDPSKKGLSEGIYHGGTMGQLLSECLAYGVQEECLYNALKDCVALKTGRTECYEAVLSYQESALEKRNLLCGKVGLKPLIRVRVPPPKD